MYVRVRPLNDAERERGAAWRVEGNSVFQVRLLCGRDALNHSLVLCESQRCHVLLLHVLGATAREPLAPPTHSNTGGLVLGGPRQ